jgi:ABC-2 type transport system ATP-binding protein
MTDTTIAIQTHSLCKQYGKNVAVKGLDLQVRRGEIFGFLGPNGAGKSTTIRMVLGLIRPTAGHSEVLGRRSGSVASRERGRVGALVEGPAFYDYLSGRRNLEILAALSGGETRERIDETLDLVGLLGREREPVRNYSHGMRQRLGLAQALLPRPELIILDEPATGLDPEGMTEVRDLLVRLNREHGMTVFLSSHLLHEVEQICSDVGVIMKGTLVARGKVRDLLADSETLVTLRVGDIPAALGVLGGLAYVSEVEATPEAVSLRCDEAALPDLNAALVGRGIRVSALVPERMSLEELYLRLVQDRQAAAAEG